ncbi:MAG: hypothetical protein ACTHKT_14315 [Solirubrobacterales bacterium]
MSTELINVRPRSLSRSERQTLARLQRAQLPAREAAAQIDGAAGAAATALRNAAQLSAAEEQYIGLAPLGERRYARIIDTYTLVASEIVAGLARPWL